MSGNIMFVLPFLSPLYPQLLPLTAMLGLYLLMRIIELPNEDVYHRRDGHR